LAEADCVPTADVSIEAAVASLPSDFSVFRAALGRTRLVRELSRPGTRSTLFAPDDAALSAWLAAAGFKSTDDVPLGALVSVLRAHAVRGRALDETALRGSSDFVNLALEPLSVDAGPVGSTGALSIEALTATAEVVAPELHDGCDAVIHGIDGVLIAPPAASGSAFGSTASVLSSSTGFVSSLPAETGSMSTTIETSGPGVPGSSSAVAAEVCRTLEAVLRFEPRLRRLSDALARADPGMAALLLSPTEGAAPLTLLAPTDSAWDTLFFLYNATEPRWDEPWKASERRDGIWERGGRAFTVDRIAARPHRHLFPLFIPQLLDDTAALTRLLAAHVLVESVPSTALVRGAAFPTALAGPDGGPLLVSVDVVRETASRSRAELVSASGVVARVVPGATDIGVCGNITVHLVDGVLSPDPLDETPLLRAAVAEAVSLGRLPETALEGLAEASPEDLAGLLGMPLAMTRGREVGGRRPEPVGPVPTSAAEAIVAPNEAPAGTPPNERDVLALLRGGRG